MALKLSASLRNAAMESQDIKHAMSNCVLKVYTGSQPATAEAAPTGTLLCTYTSSAGTPTREVRAQGKVTFSGTVASATCTGITVNSIQIMSGTVTDATGVLADFATAVAANINNNPKNQLFDASASAGVVTLTAKPGIGILTGVSNGVVVSAVTTISSADVDIGALTVGVTALNGLQWGDSAAGVLSKLSTQTWSGTAVASGTAGWCRFEAAVADAGALDSSEAVHRIDGSVGTSGAELNMGLLTITSGVVQNISSFTLTLPTA